MQEKLTSLELKLNEVALTCKRIEDMLLEHHKVLFGPNGNDESPGMIIKMDRLTEARKTHDKTVFVAWTAAIGLICKTVWDFLTRPR